MNLLKLVRFFLACILKKENLEIFGCAYTSRHSNQALKDALSVIQDNTDIAVFLDDAQVKMNFLMQNSYFPQGMLPCDSCRHQ